MWPIPPSSWYEEKADQAQPDKLAHCFIRRTTTGAASVNLVASFTPDPYYDLWLPGVGIRGQGTGGETIDILEITVRDPGGTAVYSWLNEYGVGTANAWRYVVGPLFLPAGFSIYTQVVYSAGVQSKNFTFSAMGFHTPRLKCRESRYL